MPVVSMKGNSIINRGKVRDKLLEYSEQVLSKKPLTFCPSNEDADRLVKEDPVAFVFAVILTQGAQAERMWAIPYHLKKIMGHLDANIIATMKTEDLSAVFEQLPQRPRYWNEAATMVIKAAQHINDRYGGHPERIWNDNPKGADLQSRLDSFYGIGPKKASMAAVILAKDMNIPVRNWNEIDIAVDLMIQRGFPRAGLSNSSSPSEIIESARQLNPSFPGALDQPCWDIGRQWCHPKVPECSSCYIGQVCPKIGCCASTASSTHAGD